MQVSDLGKTWYGLAAVLFGILPAATQASPPNILWITCEDMSPRLGCYGENTVPTPNIDRLATEGIRFTRAFATTGVCAPSRHALITGMYPTATYALHMRNHARTSALDEIQDPETRAYATTRPLYEAVPPVSVRCFTEHLRQAGYYCSNNVKEDYQFRKPVTAWDESSKQAHWRNREPGQPFFAVFNHTVTHESGIFGAGRSPQLVDPSRVPLPPYYPDTPRVRADLAKHYDNIMELDRQIGALLKQLEEDGLRENTVVFFFSDHGDGLPRSKRWVYDSGTRVPLIVRFPDGYRAGQTEERLVSFVDFGPTVLSLAGVEVPSQLHGIPFLGAQAGSPRAYVYHHRDRNGENRETIRSVRGPRFRYVRNYRPGQPYITPLAYRDRQGIMQDLNQMIEGQTLGSKQWQFSARNKPMEELYDTHVDPHEIHNLAANPLYFEQMAQLRVALDDWIKRCQDPLTMPESELVKQRVWPPHGVQPTTANPQSTLTNFPGNRVRVTIQCDTPGTSIGYRLLPQTESHTGTNKSWLIYDQPVTTPATGFLEMVAHRIGFKPSQRITIPLAQ